MVKRLGFGGFGKVYLLRNKTTKELRAAKHQVNKKLVLRNTVQFARKDPLSIN
jgi:hypothetical protein